MAIARTPSLIFWDDQSSSSRAPRALNILWGTEPCSPAGERDLIAGAIVQLCGVRAFGAALIEEVRFAPNSSPSWNELTATRLAVRPRRDHWDRGAASCTSASASMSSSRLVFRSSRCGSNSHSLRSTAEAKASTWKSSTSMVITLTLPERRALVVLRLSQKVWLRSKDPPQGRRRSVSVVALTAARSENSWRRVRSLV